MYSTGGVVVIFCIALVIGIFLGIIFTRLFKSISGNSDSFKEKLTEKEQQLSDYQAQVTEHFLETSRRVNNLTKNYKEVHEYLAESAAKLANPDMNKDGFSARITLAGKTTIENDDQVEILEQDIQAIKPEDASSESTLNNESSHDETIKKDPI